MSKKQPEFELQRQVCKWLSLQHPTVLFLSDTIASVKLTIPQQNRNKLIQKDNFKTPDLLIFEPRGYYSGLFIELKVKSPYKKDGTLFKDEHLEGQERTMSALREKGYYACFSWTFDMTVDIIKNYLSLPTVGR
jgi:hypothetical protein